jgi:hypothetical protein
VGVFGTSQRAVLYPSSLIDYLRLFLLAVALFCHARGNTAVFVGLVTVSFLLDLMEAHPFLRRYFANRQRNWLAAWAGVSHFGFRFAWYLGYGETWVSDVTLPGIILFELVSAYMVWIPIRAWFYSRKNTTLDDRK